MKIIPLIAVVSVLFSSVQAQPADKPLLNEQKLPLLAAPDFKAPLAESFSTMKGKWTAADGVLTVRDIPEEKHIPVLHHLVGLSAAVIELEFLFERNGKLIVGCDTGVRTHCGRVVVGATGMSLAEDSAKSPRVIAQRDMPVKAGEWHSLRLEWQGDRFAARLDGQELRAEHAYLGQPKLRSWLAMTQGVKVRHLRISGR